MLFGAAPNGSGKDPKLDLFVEGWVFGIELTFPKSAKFVVSCVEDDPLNDFSLGWVEKTSPPEFVLVLKFGGQFKFEVDWTGLLPVVGQGLVFSWAKLLEPNSKMDDYEKIWSISSKLYLMRLV